MEKQEKEKRDYIDKLEPYRGNINNFDKYTSYLLTLDMDTLKNDVDNQIKFIDFTYHLSEKWGEFIIAKLLDGGYFIGMSEELFNDVVRHKVISLEEKADRDERNEPILPFTHRKEEILKTKTRVTRSNFTKNKKRNKARDYIFENDELIKIVQHG